MTIRDENQTNFLLLSNILKGEHLDSLPSTQKVPNEAASSWESRKYVVRFTSFSVSQRTNPARVAKSSFLNLIPRL